MPKKMLDGTVTSNKMTKTLVVKTPRRYKETRLGKTVNASKKYKIHCEENGINVGDVVQFVESRPYSRDKRWRYVKTLKKAPQVVAIKEE